MTVFEELYKAAATVGFKEQDKETDQDYLKSLVLHINKVDDKTWAGLSRQAGVWFNNAAQAVNAMQVIPECPGHKAKQATPPSPPPPPVQQIKKETPKTARTTTTKSPRISKGFKKSGIVDEIRRTFVLHPDWSTKQAYDLLVKTYPNVTPETIAVNAGDIKHVIMIAREMGFWNEDKYKELAQQTQESSAEPVSN